MAHEDYYVKEEISKTEPLREIIQEV